MYIYIYIHYIYIYPDTHYNIYIYTYLFIYIYIYTHRYTLPAASSLVYCCCPDQETYVSDVASAGAEPVRFDDFCGRWEELMKDAGRGWTIIISILLYLYIYICVYF